MRRYRKALTQEQIDFRRAILRGRLSGVKNASKSKEIESITTKEDKLCNCFYYLNNCIFWVNRYIDKEIDDKRLLETAEAIRQIGEKIKSILITHQP